MGERIAIIDLGTNTFHLLIAKTDGTIVHTEKRAVRIGVRGINEGFISQDGVERALSCLKDFKSKIDEFEVSSTRAFGTSALRNASNSTEFIADVKETTGIDIEVISGDREAEFIYFGVRSAVSLGEEKSLIVDIGGGSVEFIIADHKKIFWKQSIEIGGQRLLEKFQKHDPILPEEIQSLNLEFDKSLINLKAAMRDLSPKVLVGSSGTFDTLSEIYCHDYRIDVLPNQPETPLTVEHFFRIYDQLISKNRQQRLKIPGMIEMRVDMIVVTSSLVRYLITKFGFEKVRVSSYSLKEGVLAAWLNP